MWSRRRGRLMDKSILIAFHAFKERVKGLHDDGYRVMWQSDTPGAMLHAKLVHHNGNRISIFAYPDENKLVQLTNHIKVYDGRLF